MSHRILVYGTLKRGQPNHYLIKEGAGCCRYIGRAVSVDPWPLVVAGPYHVPFLLDQKGIGKNVFGDVYEIDDEKLKVLDLLENHPTYYTRVPIEVKFVSDPDDGPLATAPEPETIAVYMIQRSHKSLLDLPMLSNYDPDGVTCQPYILPIESAANVDRWSEFIGEIKDMGN